MGKGTEIRPAKRQRREPGPERPVVAVAAPPSAAACAARERPAPHTRRAHRSAPHGASCLFGFLGLFPCVQTSVELSPAAVREIGEEMRVPGALLTAGVT